MTIFGKISELIGKLPKPWNYVVGVALLVIVISALVWGFSQIQSCSYHKAKKEYDEKEAAWSQERTKLIADAEAKEKRIAELEPQVLAFKAAADAGKKVDDALVTKIEQVGKDAAAAEAAASEPVDCLVRATRVCDLLRANNIPHDCKRITAESCKPAGQ